MMFFVLSTLAWRFAQADQTKQTDTLNNTTSIIKDLSQTILKAKASNPKRKIVIAITMGSDQAFLSTPEWKDFADKPNKQVEPFYFKAKNQAEAEAFMDLAKQVMKGLAEAPQEDTKLSAPWPRLFLLDPEGEDLRFQTQPDGENQAQDLVKQLKSAAGVNGDTIFKKGSCKYTNGDMDFFRELSGTAPPLDKLDQSCTAPLLAQAWKDGFRQAVAGNGKGNFSYYVVSEDVPFLKGRTRFNACHDAFRSGNHKAFRCCRLGFNHGENSFVEQLNKGYPNPVKCVVDFNKGRSDAKELSRITTGGGCAALSQHCIESCYMFGLHKDLPEKFRKAVSHLRWGRATGAIPATATIQGTKDCATTEGVAIDGSSSSTATSANEVSRRESAQ